MEKHQPQYITIADISCRLTIQNAKLLSYLKKVYTLTSVPKKVKISIQIKYINNRFTFSSHPYYFTASILQSKSLLAIDFLIMIFLAVRLIKYHVIFLHGSAFSKNKKGYIFIGDSGAGKSTIVKSVPQENIYADDTVILKKVKNKIYLYPSQFDKKKMISSNKKSVQLVKMFVLVQSNKNHCTNIDIPDALPILATDDICTTITQLLSRRRWKSIILPLRGMLMEVISHCKMESLYFTKKFNPFISL